MRLQCAPPARLCLSRRTHGRLHAGDSRLGAEPSSRPGAHARRLGGGLVSGRQPGVHHSDQGVHHAATTSVARLEQLGTRISMAEQGEPRQNGYAERLMRTIKEEEVALTEYRDFADAYAQIGHFLDDVYQRKRIHSALGYLTPAEFEAAYHARLLTPVVIPYKRALQCPGLRAQFNRQLPHRDLSINTGVTSMQQIADTSPHTLDQAVAYWQQQRYQVAYHDDYLAQLVRREMPEKILAVTALAALITLGAIIVVRLKKRPWHIVLLTSTSDDRVVAHHQRSRRAPAQ